MLTLTSRFLGNTFIYLFIYLQCMAPFCLVLFCQIVKQEFSDPRDADDARYNLDGRDVDGSRIIVEFAKGVSCPFSYMLSEFSVYNFYLPFLCNQN